MHDLESQFGHIDIYLFDQLLRGRIERKDSVLDAGCGHGRNLHYLLKAGFEVFAVDGNADAIEMVRAMAARLAPNLPQTNFRAESLDALSFSDASFDVVLCNAVLHFARDPAHFEAMLRECWRVLKPGGLFFSRLASSIGMKERMKPLGDGRYSMPDGTDRFLVDAAMLDRFERKLGATRLDPLKTTLVEELRCMTTWVLRKNEAGA
jgi:SAM-dependent methyltransferase